MAPDASITSVQFQNFKALANFSISLDHMNILVGPNNSGKSTVISAFRVLAIGLRRAAAFRPELTGSHPLGYRIPRNRLPITLENAQTDYQDVEATITFRLTNGNKLRLSFYSNEEDCMMYPLTEGRPVLTTTQFRQHFPISLLVVPVLGPVENREPIIRKETVDENSATHRASRNFRNYWYHYPDDFQAFRQQVITTWPGMDIDPPEVAEDGTLSLFCTENRITRELYWTGYSFQVWCQLLSHVFRSQDRSMLVIDEPDIYLHANPQRRLLSILKASGPDVLMATHSSEIVAEADANDILVIDKTQGSARRVRSPEGIQSALGSLGSIHVATMTAVAQTRRVLYVEGEDFKILRSFARRLGLSELGAGFDIAPIPLGGFPTIQRIKGVTLGVSESIGGSLSFGGIFDRDFRPDEEIEQLIERLKSELTLSIILERKEIENYLLVPKALDRTLDRLLLDKARRNGESAPAARPTAELLQEITEPMKAEIQSQYIAKRGEFLAHSGKDASTVSREAIEIFERKWNDNELRLHIVPGKRVLSEMFSRIQADYRVSLTTARIIDQLYENEIPSDLRHTLRALDSFRRKTPI